VGIPTSTTALVVAVAEGEEPNPLVPHLSELIVGTVAFLLLLLFLSKKVWPIFERVFAERTAAIQGGIEKAEKAQAEAAEALQQYQAAARRGARGGRAHPQRGAGPAGPDRRGGAGRGPRRGRSASPRPRRRRSSASASRRSPSCGARWAPSRSSWPSRIVGESLEDEARQRRTVERFLDVARGAGTGRRGAGAS
jgi:F-type H+-transporting ATPase subunit b